MRLKSPPTGTPESRSDRPAIIRPVALGIAAVLISSLHSVCADAKGLALVGARVYVSPEQAPIENAVVLINGSQIIAVGRPRLLRVPSSYVVKNVAGMTITAGFWNSHVHLTTPVLLRASQASSAELTEDLTRSFSRYGFTTVFDLASTSQIAGALKAKIRSGEVLGPRILSVGEPFYPADATPVYARPFYEQMHLPSAEVGSAYEAERRARAQLATGADGLKLFTGSIVGGETGVVHMPLAITAAVAQQAHRHAKRVFAHPTDKQGIEVALAGGVDVLAHSAPLMGTWSDQFARKIVARKVALIPTLSLFALAPNPRTPVSVAVQQTRTFARAGGVVLFGTDAGFTEEFDTTEELKLLESAIGWKNVLASLTTRPAAFFGEGETRGKVARGYTADLVVLDGDPAREISALARVRKVFAAGKPIFGTGDK